MTTGHEFQVGHLPLGEGGHAAATCSCGQWVEIQGYARPTGAVVAERLLRAKWRIEHLNKIGFTSHDD